MPGPFAFNVSISVSVTVAAAAAAARYLPRTMITSSSTLYSRS